MTITCPRCGLAFETQATTNTRCRQCRYVVRIGRSSHTRPLRQPDDDELADGSGGVGLLVFLAVGIVLAYCIVTAVRNRANTAPTSGHDGPVTGPSPYGAATSDAATQAHTGPNTADEDPAT